MNYITQSNKKSFPIKFFNLTCLGFFIVFITLLLDQTVQAHLSVSKDNLTLDVPASFNWVNLSINLPGVNAILTDIDVIGNKVWITSQSNGIYYSTDKGDNFLTSPTLATYGICMVSSMTGFAVGGSTVYATNDGGIAWSPQYLQANLRDVHFPTVLIGYAAGNVVKKTIDGGTSWNSKPFVYPNASIYAVFFPDETNPDFGFVGIAYKDPALYQTTDGGDTWQPVSLGGLTGGINALDFVDANEGWAVGNAGKIFHYSNGTWTAQTSNTTQSLNAVSFSASGLYGCAVGDMGMIVCTVDGGVHWVQEGQGMVGEALMGIKVISPFEAYVVGYGKTFLRALSVGTNALFFSLVIR